MGRSAKVKTFIATAVVLVFSINLGANNNGQIYWGKTNPLLSYNRALLEISSTDGAQTARIAGSVEFGKLDMHVWGDFRRETDGGKILQCSDTQACIRAEPIYRGVESKFLAAGLGVSRLTSSGTSLFVRLGQAYSYNLFERSSGNLTENRRQETNGLMAEVGGRTLLSSHLGLVAGLEVSSRRLDVADSIYAGVEYFTTENFGFRLSLGHRSDKVYGTHTFSAAILAKFR